ncbi:hypothetical protein [Oceanicoccus sagamiensis]|uniref:Uncharacterized protein n=1 Tax=Oceanicoccus sagamiensis TaxID=716816 RepID=A0A1X9NQX0_9GAMM|nr:hypothetical protein [Oceanicoccus sagamiensis]ARN76203.1 hypothetical protein BST96_20110 [Oceanicoccus sagamiensis]
MKIFKIGDSKQAMCETCGSLQRATFALRDVPLSDGSGVVKSVLVGVCDQCDNVSLLPHQSTPVVQKQLLSQRKPVESRLPAHMIDILNLAALAVGGSTDFIQSLMKYYIFTLVSDQNAAKTLSRFLSSDLAKGRAEKRLSLKGRRLYDDVDTLKAITDIDNTTDLIKGVILKIHDDLLVKKKPKPLEQLKNIAAAMA